MLLYQAARHQAITMRENFSQTALTMDDLVDLAASLDASVYFSDKLDYNTTGAVIKHVGQAPRIYVNSSLSPTTQRYALVHQIGHIVERNMTKFNHRYSFKCGYTC